MRNAYGSILYGVEMLNIGHYVGCTFDDAGLFWKDKANREFVAIAAKNCTSFLAQMIFFSNPIHHNVTFAQKSEVRFQAFPFRDMKCHHLPSRPSRNAPYSKYNGVGSSSNISIPLNSYNAYMRTHWESSCQENPLAHWCLYSFKRWHCQDHV